MRILITGGLGVIGSCLAANLFRKGNEVTIYDNMEIGSIRNLKVYLNDEEISKISVIKKDILDKEEIALAISDSDMVYHLAATLGTLKVVAQPSRMLNVNSVGTHSIADLCVAAEVPLIMMSTSMVYGQNPKASVTEDDDLFIGGKLNLGLWWYAISKMADEAYANSLMLENSKAKILVIRPFNVIAPIQNHEVGFVFPRFFEAAFSDEPLLVYGDGSQERSFTWAPDFVDCLVKLVEKEIWRMTINIGGTDSISILDLAKKIVKVTNCNSEVKLIDPQALFNNQFVEIPKRVPNVSLLKEKIGIAPSTNIDQMISNFHKFYKAKSSNN